MAAAQQGTAQRGQRSGPSGLATSKACAAPSAAGRLWALHALVLPTRACPHIRLSPLTDTHTPIPAGALPVTWGGRGAFPRLVNLYLSGNNLGDPSAPGGLPLDWTRLTVPRAFPSLQYMMLYPGNDNVCAWLSGNTQGGERGARDWVCVFWGGGAGHFFTDTARDSRALWVCGVGGAEHMGIPSNAMST